MPCSRGGHDGAGQLAGAADLPDADDGHDAGQDGHGDAPAQGPEEEAVEHVIVEEHLGGEEVHPRVHLPLQVVQVGGEVGALHVPLRVAGGADAQRLPAGEGPQAGDELIGVAELPRPGEGGVLGDVPPEGQDVFDPRGPQLLRPAGHLLPGGGDVRWARAGTR